MSTYSLFHRPSFGTKLQKVENLTHVKALFAAMFSFSARFQSVPINNDSLNSLQPRVFDHTRFRENALDLIQRSLGNPDEEPSLCLLQAMALSSFYELTKGVQGRAWRLLGSCVRVAYELHLHLVDYESRSTPIPDGSRSSSWSAAEEKRRCWWAIWDMDIFASTIRRCPTAIDSSMIDTQLPVSDEFWFNNEFHASCFLDTDPGERVRALVNCKNECAFAWLIVINSIMRNAQVLLRGNLQGILLDVCPLDNLDQLLHYFRSSFSKAKGEEATTKLIALEQALVEVSKAIPESLAYRQEALDFTNTENPRLTHREARKLHSAVFNILLSTQLARFMIYHSYAFGEIVSGTLFAGNQGTTSGCMPSAIAAPIIPANAQGWRNCLEAADNILAIVTRCPESHVKYVNPFLASTVWLAAALQIVRKVYGNNIDAELIQSKVDCLRATCEKYAAFWQTPRRMLENLDTLEHRLLQLGHGAMTAEGFSVGKGSVSMLSGLIRTDTATPVRHGPSFPDTSNHLSMPTLGEECSYQSQVGAISPAAEDGAYWNLSPAAGHIHNAAMQTDPTWLYDLMDLSPSKIFS
ncbi:fungal specific transcription factor domain-containing protein [Aspergillus fischeri NRRL 181]|uniref:Fungal specific transcription factor, putative n=1 Tax=Neosartorya fischeri (strain ATCC 1020 / DSM 3700 / CBS 544.65 / FGSC A1164 / JCM 1740 / NRRL 181 / WB 181) TaxID=331117 RepID=A1DKS0_NEOFI|nr:fungal specific transcription factor, putative [Aspergillus fischeri NRRL 181]EAW15391.1 fungal specific transcription factor, putative [Aspergillus fischeri NRRL 181]